MQIGQIHPTTVERERTATSGATAVSSLADFLVSLTVNDLSAGAKHSALRCILDAVSCAAAGRRIAMVGNSSRWARDTFSRGPASIWFEGTSMSPLGAAFANSFATSVLDADDGHRAASGHPGAAVIPAVLAVGEAIDARLEELVLAIVCGYEAGVSVASARDSSPLNTRATGRWASVAVAAAVGKLLGLTTTQLADAISLAEAQAPNMAAADHAGFTGSHSKEGIPWSVLTGMAAAEQASLGMKGYLGALDNPAVYSKALVLRCQTSAFLIETTYFKPYACCRWIHAAIDAVLDLRREGLDPRAAVRVEVASFRRALSLSNLVQPPDIISAQFSIPFVVAVALLDGGGALLPMSPDLLDRSDVIELADKIVSVLDPELEACFPVQVPARVTVETRRGTLKQEVRVPRGDPLNPLSDIELVEKAVRLCGAERTAEDIRHFAAALLGWPAAKPAAELSTTILAFLRPANVARG